METFPYEHKSRIVLVTDFTCKNWVIDACALEASWPGAAMISVLLGLHEGCYCAPADPKHWNMHYVPGNDSWVYETTLNIHKDRRTLEYF